MAKNDSETEADFTGYLDKAPTDLQTRFTEWLMDTVGYEPSKAKTKEEAFKEGVRLATALRMPFQRSPENQEVLEERRSAREEAVSEKANRASKKAEPTKVRRANTDTLEEPVKAKKAAKGKAAKVAEEPEEAPAPKRGKAAKGGKVERTTRRAAVQADADDEAPF